MLMVLCPVREHVLQRQGWGGRWVRDVGLLALDGNRPKFGGFPRV